MMERKHLHGITLLGGLAMALLCGCIRDELEPCPPLRLSLEVADKNYVNSAAAARLGYGGGPSVRRIFPSGSMCRTWPIG